MEKKTAYVKSDVLEKFMKDVFIGLGVPEKDAAIVAEVLITADRYGIDSHGCGRLLMYYLRLKRKQQLPTTEITIEKERASIARLNGNNGMGHVVGHFAMELAIKKAKETGIGMVTVGNSTHYGIAGYYALMAAQNDCIGIVGTNARPSIAPTWGVEPKIGTNPLTIGLPTNFDYPWVADHATSITQRGKIELYARLGKKVPQGWVINEFGKSESDSNKVLKDLLDKKAALAPLGGIGESLGGYKGYNYATLVEILSSCLSSASFLSGCSGFDSSGNMIPYNLGHFFIAIDINSFIPVSEFKEKTTSLLNELKNSKKMPGAAKIFIAWEKEHQTFLEREKTGIPISEETQKQLLRMKNELNLTDYDFGFNVEYEAKDTPGW